jgi:hypothetical protein
MPVRDRGVATILPAVEAGDQQHAVDPHAFAEGVGCQLVVPRFSLAFRS